MNEGSIDSGIQRPARKAIDSMSPLASAVGGSPLKRWTLMFFSIMGTYRKNDQAFVEQKNGAVVRRMVGYRRLEGLEAAAALAGLGIAHLDPLGKSRPIDDDAPRPALDQFRVAQPVQRDEWLGRKTTHDVFHFQRSHL